MATVSSYAYAHNTIALGASLCYSVSHLIHASAFKLLAPSNFSLPSFAILLHLVSAITLLVQSFWMATIKNDEGYFVDIATGTILTRPPSLYKTHKAAFGLVTSIEFIGLYIQWCCVLMTLLVQLESLKMTTVRKWGHLILLLSVSLPALQLYMSSLKPSTMTVGAPIAIQSILDVVAVVMVMIICTKHRAEIKLLGSSSKIQAIRNMTWTNVYLSIALVAALIGYIGQTAFQMTKDPITYRALTWDMWCSLKYVGVVAIFPLTISLLCSATVRKTSYVSSGRSSGRKLTSPGLKISTDVKYTKVDSRSPEHRSPVRSNVSAPGRYETRRDKTKSPSAPSAKWVRSDGYNNVAKSKKSPTSPTSNHSRYDYEDNRYEQGDRWRGKSDYDPKSFYDETRTVYDDYY